MNLEKLEKANQLNADMQHLQQVLTTIESLNGNKVEQADIFIYMSAGNRKNIVLNSSEFSICMAHLLTHVSLLLTDKKKQFQNL